MDEQNLKRIAKYIRYLSLASTTAAGSGHPSSAMSATDLMTVLMFGGYFKADLDDPKYKNNDRLIFSKGHASPLFYGLYVAAGKVSEEELMDLRKFDSPLEGHPTMNFPYTEAATGSLGQGLSVGIGMALNAKYLDKLPYKTYVLLGDSEMAEGSCWEAIQLAAYYKLDNLVGIIDVNRLGQRGETMFDHDTDRFEGPIKAFGWETIVVDGHSLQEIDEAYKKAALIKDKPVMIIAKTLKGKGVSFVENEDNWHGKPLSEEDFGKAISELGDIDKNVKGVVVEPEKIDVLKNDLGECQNLSYEKGDKLATRKAYGNALKRLGAKYKNLVVVDAETSNSTYANKFKADFDDRFFEMFIAEQNMVGVALGFSKREKVPFASSFAAFLTRAFDQIRMLQYSDANVKICGSHAGVSIGQDGASQMGLEDIAMMRTLLGSTVLYPSDAVCAERLVEESIKNHGVFYIRTTRGDTPIIYDNDEEFKIGGSKVVKSSSEDKITVVGAGITLFEALKAYDILKKEGINIRVVDLYSIKPIDVETLKNCAKETGMIITVEDHFAEGGVGEAVCSALVNEQVEIFSLAVKKMPRSGSPDELLNFEEISAGAIVKLVNEKIK